MRVCFSYFTNTYSLLSSFALCSFNASKSTGGIGIFRPVPASVLDLPTVRIAFSKSIQSHFILRISIGLSPQRTYVVCTTNDNHQCVCGNIGEWYNSKDEFFNAFMTEGYYWSDLEDQGLISWDEARKKCPCGYECWSCGFCGKWTGNMYYRGDGDSSDTVVKDPPPHIY